jgi:hypothetical protein
VNRLNRFEEYRFIGVRDTMRFYDCDDETQMGALQQRVIDDDLMTRDLLQSFAPDTELEAMNRSFAPVRGV